MEAFELLGLGLNAWITVFTVILVFSLMIFTKAPADFVFVGSTAFLYITGVLSTKSALAGFSSSSVIIVGVLGIVIAGLTKTGVLSWIVKNLLGTPSSYKVALLRLMSPVAVMSAFLSNTTVVQMFINVVLIWSKKLKIAPSRFLIPLSYASVLGGVSTVIGTPPNLIIAGMYGSETGTQMNIFAITPLALICMIVGFLSIIALHKLLPIRKAPSDNLKDADDFTVELLVPTDNPNIGSTLEEANLYKVNGAHIVEILRFDKEVMYPVQKDEIIMGGDRLIYDGNVLDILSLKSSHNLVNATKHIFKVTDVNQHRNIQIVNIPSGSNLIGKKMRKISFEDKYNVVLIAISRQGARIEESPRDIMIKAGDSLILECDSSFLLKKDDLQKDLVMVSVNEKQDYNSKTIVSSLIMLAMVLLTAFNIIPLLEASFIAAFFMLITKCTSFNFARKNIDWGILMVFAGSITLGTAIKDSGISVALANGVLNICGNSPYIVMMALYLVTTILTEFISNTASAAIIFPIAYQLAITLGVNPMTILGTVMIASSASFATPIGSPTHMLAYAAGGYRFTDFMKIGLIMNLIMFIITCTFAPLIWPF